MINQISYPNLIVVGYKKNVLFISKHLGNLSYNADKSTNFLFENFFAIIKNNTNSINNF